MWKNQCQALRKCPQVQELVFLLSRENLSWYSDTPRPPLNRVTVHVRKQSRRTSVSDVLHLDAVQVPVTLK